MMYKNALQKTLDVNVSASKFKHMSKTYLLEFSLDVFYSKSNGYLALFVRM